MATVKYEGVKKKKEGSNLGFLKKLPPWAWIIIAFVFILFILWYRSRQAAVAATQSDQGAGGTASQGQADYMQGYQDAMLGSYGAGGVGGGYGGGGGYYITDPNTGAGSGQNPSGSSSGSDPSGNSPGQGLQPITVNVTATPSTSTGGGPPVRPTNHGAGSVSAAQLALLAPGASYPGYNLVRPAGKPNALWSGTRSPGKGWVGVGGGWWAPPKK